MKGPKHCARLGCPHVAAFEVTATFPSRSRPGLVHRKAERLCVEHTSLMDAVVTGGAASGLCRVPLHKAAIMRRLHEVQA